jgi:hypothetical protein
MLSRSSKVDPTIAEITHQVTWSQTESVGFSYFGVFANSCYPNLRSQNSPERLDQLIPMSAEEKKCVVMFHYMESNHTNQINIQ